MVNGDGNRFYNAVYVAISGDEKLFFIHSGPKGGTMVKNDY